MPERAMILLHNSCHIDAPLYELSGITLVNPEPWAVSSRLGITKYNANITSTLCFFKIVSREELET